MSSSGMRPIIRVEGLGKQYRIGHHSAPYHTLRDSLAGALRAPWARLRRKEPTTIWALEDVSFEVAPGEVVGIIGRNGAGKSTLLKLLTRVTEPTRGRAELYGRVGSLLEVGTGFHPELTGRENIYLNGAILGMGRAELDRKFDEIVAFSEVEEFLDTPVKHYSSGMYVRLAFSVAVHLDSEILLVDEVLAVGDAQFQRKCLAKISEIGAHGRTVLFVSHAMASVTRLCKRVILLERGHVAADGDAETVARAYFSRESAAPTEVVWPSRDDAPGDGVARLHAVRVRSEGGEAADVFDIRRPVKVEVEYWNLQRGQRPTAVIHLINSDGTCLFASNDFNDRAWWNAPRTPGLVRSTCTIPGNFLAEGRFTVLAAVVTYVPFAPDSIVHALEPEAVSFKVVDHSRGDGVRGEYAGSWPGVLRPMLEWTVVPHPTD